MTDKPMDKWGSKEIAAYSKSAELPKLASQPDLDREAAGHAEASDWRQMTYVETLGDASSGAWKHKPRKHSRAQKIKFCSGWWIGYAALGGAVFWWFVVPPMAEWLWAFVGG